MARFGVIWDDEDEVEAERGSMDNPHHTPLSHQGIVRNSLTGQGDDDDSSVIQDSFLNYKQRTDRKTPVKGSRFGAGDSLQQKALSAPASTSRDQENARRRTVEFTQHVQARLSPNASKNQHICLRPVSSAQAGIVTENDASPGASRRRPMDQTTLLPNTRSLALDRSIKRLEEQLATAHLHHNSFAHVPSIDTAQLAQIDLEIKQLESHNDQVIMELKQKNLTMLKDLQETLKESVSLNESYQESLRQSQLAAQEAERRAAAAKIEVEQADKKKRLNEEKEKAAAALAAKQQAENEASAKAAAQRAKKEADCKAKEAATDTAKKATESQKVTESVPPLPGQVVEYLDLLQNIKSTIRPQIKSTPALSQAAFKMKMEINKKLGQLTHSTSKVIFIAKGLHDVLVQSQSFSSPPLTTHMVDITAKLILNQTAKEVAVKQDMAFPLAILVVYLMNKFSEFRTVFLAKMAKKCPYTIPYFYAHEPKWTRAEYLKRLGYKIVDDEGGVESTQHYVERMRGYLSLHFAVMQTTLIANTFGLENAWAWLASVVNACASQCKPLTGTLLLTMLEVAGSEMQRVYGKQFKKLVDVVVSEVLPKMPEKDVAERVRLELFLQESWLKTGQIPEHAGKTLTK